MTRLWDKGAPLDERVLRFTAGEDHALDNRLVAYDVRASIAHAEMLQECGLLAQDELDAIRNGLTEIAAAHARGEWSVTLDLEDGQTALETLLTRKIGTAGARLHAGRSRNDQVLTALRLYLRDVVEDLAEGARHVAEALDGLTAGQGSIALPGYTHMQQAMPSTVALWAQGFAAEIRDDIEGLRHSHRRIGKNPLGSAAGYGTPNLPVNRDATRTKLAFAANHEPVTAVQLSRGKAEAEVLFQVALLMQDLGRLAVGPAAVLYARVRLRAVARCVHDRFVDHAAEAQSGRLRAGARPHGDGTGVPGGSARHHGQAALGLPARPAADQGAAVPLDRLLPRVARHHGRCDSRATVRAGTHPHGPDIHAAAEANELVAKEGIPFREAYQRVGAKYRRET